MNVCFKKYELYCKPSKVGEGRYNFKEHVIDSDSAHEVCKALGMDRLSREKVYALYLDTALNLIGVVEVSAGAVDSAVVDMKVVFGPALSLGKCSGVILAHNHPSGKLTPSDDDRALTKRLKKAGDILGIKLVDHIIIGENEYLSMKNEGMIN